MAGRLPAQPKSKRRRADDLRPAGPRQLCRVRPVVRARVTRRTAPVGFAALAVQAQSAGTPAAPRAACLSREHAPSQISAWAAILFAPTLIGTVYGMNFQAMPELGWQLGYPLALVLMMMVSISLHVVFKHRSWI